MGTACGGGALQGPAFSQNTIFDGEAAGRILLINVVNYIGEPSTTLMKKSFIEHHQYEWTYIKPEYDIIDVPIWLNLLTKGNLFYFAEPLSCFRLHGGNDQKTNNNILVGGMTCWMDLIQTAWYRNRFLTVAEDYRTAIQRLLRSNLQVFRSQKYDALSEGLRKDYERSVSVAFFELSQIRDENCRQGE